MLIFTQLGADMYLRWLSERVEDFEHHDQDAWLSHAEAVAMDSCGDIVIEVSARESVTGTPHTLQIPKKYFQKN